MRVEVNPGRAHGVAAGTYSSCHATLLGKAHVVLPMVLLPQLPDASRGNDAATNAKRHAGGDDGNEDGHAHTDATMRKSSVGHDRMRIAVSSPEGSPTALPDTRLATNPMLFQGL
eukprot:14812355-Alexandrium_andersonii.AAC.1